MFCSQPVNASLSAPWFFWLAWVMRSASFARRCAVARTIPNPYSALSSKREFAQAGPKPFALVVNGTDGAEPPQIEEHPVALAIIIRSPNSCVMVFKYGVSPHPEHAPENSRSGCWNCEPFTVYLSNPPDRTGIVSLYC